MDRRKLQYEEPLEIPPTRPAKQNKGALRCTDWLAVLTGWRLYGETLNIANLQNPL